MPTTPNYKMFAKAAVQQEADALSKLVELINDDFVKVFELCLACSGRIVVTGIGKSAIIAQKLVATFNSTGAPALYMHAADAIHGDLGMVQSNDVVICISKSGNSPEIKVLVPLIKAMGNTLVALAGNLAGYLAQNADFVLDSTVERESCPNNLAPTTSTTAQMVIGNALAVCLIEARGFGKNDFAKYHPGGALGKKLYLKVADVIAQYEKPSVNPDSSLEEVILSISAGRLGATVVLENARVVGLITDGDLRRMLAKSIELSAVQAKDIMSVKPKTIESNELAFTAFNQMEMQKITQLLVIEQGEYKGLIHLHDILKEGIF